jgi:hypothetical protein
MEREIIRVEPFDTNFEKWGAPVSVCTRAGDMVFVSGISWRQGAQVCQQEKESVTISPSAPPATPIGWSRTQELCQSVVDLAHRFGTSTCAECLRAVGAGLVITT